MLCALTELSLGENILFCKTSRNYGRDGPRGNKFRQEFEARMFKHHDWLQRLFVVLYEPDVDQTLEVYAKPDGSRWLNYTRATPSVSKAIDAERWGYDTKKELKAVHIMTNEIALPPNVAAQIELLWRAMLPGLTREPESQRVYMDHLSFVAFRRDNDSVQTGRIAIAAIDTPAYHAFADIVEDLIKACNGMSKEQRLARLPSKMHHLQSLLTTGKAKP